MALTRHRTSSNQSSSTSYTFTFSEPTPLGDDHGLVAVVRRYHGSNNPAPSTPDGWTLERSAVTSGTTFRTWVGVFTRRGDGATNGITITGSAADTSIALMAAPADRDDFLDTVPAIATAHSNVTTLAGPEVTTTTEDATYVAFAALGGTAGGSGVALTNVSMRAGTGSSSSLAWGEATRPTPGAVSSTATWTNPGKAHVGALAFRSPAPVEVDESNVTLHWTVSGVAREVEAFWGDGAVCRPVEVHWPAPELRDVLLQPYASTSPFNTALSTAAVYADTSDPATARMAAQTSGTINRQFWSVEIRRATMSDPVVWVENLNPNPAEQDVEGIRIPADFQPPLGSGGFTADGNSVVIQPDGQTGHDFYRLTKVTDTHWTSTSIDAQDFTGSGIVRGVRAANIGLANGLIRPHEVAARHIPHALAMSIPKESLKVGYVWPANAEDNQANVPYSGPIPMGSLFAIPPDVNLATLGLTADGLALATALQDYGAYVVDQSSSWAFYAQPSCDATRVNAMAAAVGTLLPLLRRVTSNGPSTPGGGPLPRRAPDAAPLAA